MTKFKINYKNNFINKIGGDDGYNSIMFILLYNIISTNPIWNCNSDNKSKFFQETINYDMNMDLIKIKKIIRLPYKHNSGENCNSYFYEVSKTNINDCINLSINENDEHIYINIIGSQGSVSELALINKLSHFYPNKEYEDEITYNTQTLRNLVHLLSLKYNDMDCRKNTLIHFIKSLII